MIKHFLSIADTPTEDLKRMLTVAFELRDQREAGAGHGGKKALPVTENPPRKSEAISGRAGATSGRAGATSGGAGETSGGVGTLAMLFQKPSLRTRVSFEQAMSELGGHAIVLGQGEVGLGERESAGDVARVLDGMVQGIAARVFDHQHLVAMAQVSGVPVINMLSDQAHPAQALADVMTMMDAWGRDFEALKGKHVVFVGDGNNVARSLAMLCGKLGMCFTLASPPDYAFEDDFAQRIMSCVPGMDFTMTHDPGAAVAYADVIYADTFVSMGQESEKARRLAAFERFQINDALLAGAHNRPIVLHCLPAYRGVEITDAVMDGPHSRVFPQAHNRLHAQKGLLAVLMGPCV